MALKWRHALILLFGLMLCFALSAVTIADKYDKDQKLTIDQLPTAVRATLEAQAQGGTIEDLEKETEDGVEFYSADIIKGDQKIEVEIALDGQLIKSRVDGEKEDSDKDGQCGKEEAKDAD